MSVVSIVGGVAARVTGNVLLGDAMMVLGAAAYVGQKIFKTFYKIKYQSQRSDCRTYVRERKVFYQYNNYTGKVKETFYYFHS